MTCNAQKKSIAPIGNDGRFLIRLSGRVNGCICGTGQGKRCVKMSKEQQRMIRKLRNRHDQYKIRKWARRYARSITRVRGKYYSVDTIVEHWFRHMI